MNDQEIQEMLNEEGNVQLDWNGNNQIVENNVQLGMVRIFPSFHANQHTWLGQENVRSINGDNQVVAIPNSWVRSVLQCYVVVTTSL
jgi:hypothetical protein